MLKRIKVKLNAHIKNAESKSEEEKMRLVWFWTILFMVGVFGVWIINASNNLASLRQRSFEVSGLPEFSQTENIDVGGVLQEGGQILSQYSEQNKAQWKQTGDNYIKDKNVLADDSFSVLKLGEMTSEDGAVLLKYEHYYKNVLVLNSGIVLAVDLENGSISEKENNLKKGLDISVDPAVSAKEAVEIATAEIKDNSYAFTEAVLAIGENEEKYYLVWQTIFKKEDSDDKQEILVGAKHGGIFSLSEPISGQQATTNQLKNITE